MNGVFELPVEPVPYRQNTSRLSALEQIEDMMDKIAKAELGSLSSSAGVLEAVRDVIYPSPGGGPLEERLVVQEGDTARAGIAPPGGG